MDGHDVTNEWLPIYFRNACKNRRRRFRGLSPFAVFVLRTEYVKFYNMNC
jgi:hypothetical protein